MRFFGPSSTNSFVTIFVVSVVASSLGTNSFVATAQSVTVDTNDFCFGSSQSFTTSSSSNTYEELAYAVQYPTAFNGGNYTCVMSCATTTGTAYLQGVVTTSSTISSPTEGTVTSTTDGCTSDLVIELTASQCANLVAVAYCSDGCLSASMNCIESWRSSLGTRVVSSIATRLNNLFYDIVGGGRGGGGHRGRGRRIRNRNLLLEKDDNQPFDDEEKHDDKYYIRARKMKALEKTSSGDLDGASELQS